MNKHDMLIIRACRCSKDPVKRLKSLRKRYYIRDEEVENYHIISKLAEIIDTYFSIKVCDIIDYLNPHNNRWAFEKYNYNNACLQMLINKIRFYEVNELPKDFIIPRMFREKNETGLTVQDVINRNMT